MRHKVTLQSEKRDWRSDTSRTESPCGRRTQFALAIQREAFDLATLTSSNSKIYTARTGWQGLVGMCTLLKKRLLSETLKKEHFDFDAGRKKSFLQARCALHLVLVTIISCALVVSCYCRKTSDLAFSRGESVRSAGRISTSTQDVSRAFHKLDAPHLVLVTILSFALVVSR